MLACGVAGRRPPTPHQGNAAWPCSANCASSTARNARSSLASFLGWTLDAFDYFLLVFVIPEIAQRFPCRHRRGRVLADADAGDASARRFALRPARRSLRTAADADGRHRAVRRARSWLGARALADRAAGACARCSASRWAASGASARRWRWNRFRRRRAAPCPACCRKAMRCGYLLGGAVLSRCCSITSAGAACSRSASCRRCSCCTSAATCRNRRCGRGARRAARRGRASRNDARALEAVRLSDRADDGVQHVQPRLAGSLSDVPEAAAPLRHAHGRHADGRAESRRDRRRPVLRRVVGKGRPPPRDHRSRRCWRCR